MSVEDRMRSGLVAEAELVLPRTEAQLDEVLRRRRRRQTARRGAIGVAAAAAAMVGAVVVPGLLPTDSRSGPAAVPALRGTYAVVVPRSDDAAREDMVGRWTVTFADDNTLTIDAPPSYGGSPSGSAYSVDGGRLTTNAFLYHPGCQTGSSGQYSWTIEGSTVSFDLVDDGCPARLILFGAEGWERTS